MAWTYAPWTPQQLLTFTASLTDSSGKSAALSLVVLAGDGHPTIKGGWPKIQVIDRPRRIGYTMPTGYDPLSMDIPVQFDSTVALMPDYMGTREYIDGRLNFNVETNIQILERMAGRGNYPTNGIHAGEGDPPLLQVASWMVTPSGGSRQSDLIPRNVQNTIWVISNIDYDDQPISNIWGSRIQQKATVSLSQWIPVLGATPGRKKATKSTSKLVVYKTSAGYATVARVVQRYTHHSDVKTYDLVMKTCRQHGTNVTSYNKVLPLNTKIYIPQNLTVV